MSTVQTTKPDQCTEVAEGLTPDDGTWQLFVESAVEKILEEYDINILLFIDLTLQLKTFKYNH